MTTTDAIDSLILAFGRTARSCGNWHECNKPHDDCMLCCIQILNSAFHGRRCLPQDRASATSVTVEGTLTIIRSPAEIILRRPGPYTSPVA